MPQDRSFYNSLLQCMTYNKNSSVLLNLASSMQHASKNDLYQILELLHVTHDMQIQVKLFSILAAYMGIHSDVIIKFNPLYDKISVIITRGLPQKTNVTLNFLSAMLYTDNEDGSTRRKTLVVYAQNMIRTSSCLTAMSNLFSSGMLHQDTWRALCRCLAESCSGLEVNQKYCSHLIPLCVRRCKQGNEHVFQLLQSLLCDNEHNIRLFYEIGGNCIFTREFLKYEECLQLLNTIVSKTFFKTKLLKETDVLFSLQDLKRMCGPLSQVGQWVTIILYTMSINNQGFTKEMRKDNTYFQSPKIIPVLNSISFNDTSQLFQNVIKEVLTFEPRKNLNTYETSKLCKPYLMNDMRRNNIENKRHDIKRRNINCTTLQNSMNAPHQSNNLSFSFLMRKHSEKTSTNDCYIDNANNFSNAQSKRKQIDLSLQKSDQNCNYLSSNLDDMETNDEVMNKESTLDFRPTFVSTPKNVYRSKVNSQVSQRHLPINKNYKTRRFKKSNDEKVKRVPKKLDKNIKQRTIGARLLDVINESCTTIIKSVRNVFKPKRIEESITKTSENIQGVNISHRSNSFMNYMRKRDALLNEQNSDGNSYLQNECNTCNDTLCLKRKFANDDFLRETVKKLKLGINLYGCDFKKISKTLWPHENYMTPSVLYNLYRKLIAK